MYWKFESRDLTKKEEKEKCNINISHLIQKFNFKEIQIEKILILNINYKYKSFYMKIHIKKFNVKGKNPIFNINYKLYYMKIWYKKFNNEKNLMLIINLSFDVKIQIKNKIKKTYIKH